MNNTKINQEDRDLLKKWAMTAFVVFVIGYLIDYSILNSWRYLDKSFTSITANVSKHLLHWITGADIGAYVESIGIQICTSENHCIYVGDACNGRNLYIIFVGLLISIPFGNWKNKLIYSIVGSSLIFLANIIRIILLVVFIDISVDLFDIFHHYIFQLLLYLLMFGIWSHYFNKFKQTYDE